MPDWSFMPDQKERRSDWEVSLVADLSGGVGLAGGCWVFNFRNGTYYGTNPDMIAYLGMEYLFLFLGVGAGVGGGEALGKKLGLKQLAELMAKAAELAKAVPGAKQLARNLVRYAKGKPFHPLPCDTAFCVNDLDDSVGVLGGGAIGAGPGYTYLVISAYTFSQGWLFHGRGASGLTIAAGAGASVTGGLWVLVD